MSRYHQSMFFYVEPEVAGGLGPRTRFEQEGRISHLNYEFDGWLGDAILETTPCFIATEVACQMIDKAGLTGVSFGEVEVSRSQTFAELYPSRELPSFRWMLVEGQLHVDDFGIAPDKRLMVSEAALSTLKAAGLNHALVEGA